MLAQWRKSHCAVCVCGLALSVSQTLNHFMGTCAERKLAGRPAFSAEGLRHSLADGGLLPAHGMRFTSQKLTGMCCAQVVRYQGRAAVPLPGVFGGFSKVFFVQPDTFELYGRVEVVSCKILPCLCSVVFL